jgi:glutathione synthase/RimK-type ligase-like ATP-grasp enzyme
LNKVKRYLSRVHSMSFRRMSMYVNRCMAESGRSMLSISNDMVLCSLRYGVGYMDYYVFGFSTNRRHAARSSFMTMNDNYALVNKVNDRKKRIIFEDKTLFCKTFPEYFGRDFLVIQDSTEEQVSDFIRRHPVFIAKTSYGYGGFGVRMYKNWVPSSGNPKEELSREGIGLLEERITQHPLVKELNPTSINSVRIVTVMGRDGVPRIAYALQRIGRLGSIVDNISSGGMYSLLDEDGRITKPAFCDSLGTYFDVHPENGTPFIGFQVPMFDKCKELALNASYVVPEVRYVGWDVTVTRNGPILIEGNSLPAYDMCQNKMYLKDGTGMLSLFEELSGEKIRNSR